MKVVVYPNYIAIIGGSQINAIDLAAAVAYVGHDVIVFGIEGVLVDYIEKKGFASFLLAGCATARRLHVSPSFGR